MKTAILGGRFDPPHIGHYWIAQQVLDFVPDVSNVLLVPASRHQWKGTVASAEDRLRMTRMLTNDSIHVSDIELSRGGISYTIDTIKAVKEQTGNDVYWIVGSDIVLEFEKWDKRDELLSETEFLVFPRDPYHLPENLRDGFRLIDNKNLLTSNISSTVVRDRIANGLPIDHFVPKRVEEYIWSHSLYK